MGDGADDYLNRMMDDMESWDRYCSGGEISRDEWRDINAEGLDDGESIIIRTLKNLPKKNSRKK